MKSVFICLALFSIIATGWSQTEVNGNQSGNWTIANSPYLVIGEIIVPAGQTLSIEAGVEVNFQGYYKFTVLGNLQATGTVSEMIYFTTDNQSVGWGGIRFDNATGISSLSFCRIEYGKTSGTYPDINGGGMALLNSNIVASNCVFADNDATGEENGMGGAIYAINTGGSTALTQFIDCIFLRNHAYGEGGAIKFTNDHNSEIINCEFIENNCFYGGGAISFYSVIGTKVITTLFVNNYTTYSNGGAINTLGTGNAIELKNCTITGNTAPGGEGGGISLAYANIDIVNTIIYDNPGLYGDDLIISIGGAAEINYSNLVMPSGGTGTNNINEDPLFVNSNALDFELLENSPCIDAGTDIGLDYVGNAPDMGCFEYGTLAITNLQAQNIFVYPNPSKGRFTIINTNSFKSINITDVFGKIIYTKKTIKNELEINIQNFKTGVYFLNILLETGNAVTKKIILVR